MNTNKNYQKAFIMALLFHVTLALLLLLDMSNNTAALDTTKSNILASINNTEAHEIIKAESIDSREVIQAVNRLKQAQATKLKQEQLRQDALKKEVSAARLARIQEQEHLLKLKQEAVNLANLKQKQIDEETHLLKELAQKKQQEASALNELKIKQELLKKNQQQAQEELLSLKKQHALEKNNIAKLNLEKLKNAEQAAITATKDAEKTQQQQLQASQDAAKNAQALAGEVNKYKAMIVAAIGQHWILPDKLASGLSSQFKIHLGPNGVVLDVSLIRSSGDPILDRSAQMAIYKASPLPVPSDPAINSLFRDISLTVRPENSRG